VPRSGTHQKSLTFFNRGTIMSKIKNIFNNKKAFIAYITAGYMGIDFSLKAALALIEGGVDILEVGVPFSDPVADGPVIQKAAMQSLENGTTIFDVLNLIKRIKAKSNTPIVLFSYFNPILQAIEKDFFIKAKEAGVDGILVVDLPLEEADEFAANCYTADIDPIFIVSVITDKKRIKQIGNKTRGFVYYACRKGTTGVKGYLPPGFDATINEIKQETGLPVVAGFGISNRKMAQEVIQCADGFVVGSLFVDAIGKGATAAELKKLAQQIDPR
jgi:tryptophan synthase alpha chain